MGESVVKLTPVLGAHEEGCVRTEMELPTPSPLLHTPPRSPVAALVWVPHERKPARTTSPCPLPPPLSPPPV